MNRVVTLAFILIPLALGSLLGAGGCIPTTFGLGYLTRAVTSPSQTQTSCYLNGTPVDCSTVQTTPQ